MKPKPFWELKNFTVPVAILASLKRTNALDSHDHSCDPISGFGVFLGKARRGRCKAGKISNVGHIGPVPSVCNEDLVLRIARHPCPSDFGSDNLDDLRIGLSGPNGV